MATDGLHHASVGDDAIVSIIVIVSMCVMTPVIEEVFFRQYLWDKVAAISGRKGALILTSIFWTAVHFDNFPQHMLIILPFAIVFGFLRYNSQGISVTISAHMAMNVIGTIHI